MRIEMDEEENSSSDYSDDALRMIEGLLGPEVKNNLLLPTAGVKIAIHNRDDGVSVGA